MMAFILEFLLFFVCQNAIFANVLNTTETSKDQNVTNICTDQEIFDGNCSFISEKNESLFENQTSSKDILNNTTNQDINFSGISELNNFTNEEELTWLTTDSSESSTNRTDGNVNDIIFNSTSVLTEESFNQSLEITTNADLSPRDQETRGSITNSSNFQKNVLVLKSNCSVENSSEFTSRYLTKVGCIVYIQLNYVSQNDSEAEIAKLIQELKPLSIRSGEFDIVKRYEGGDIPVNEDDDKISVAFFDRETFAYLAVACSFAIVLLIACIIFGLRCLKKKKPVFDISTFDLKLSDYTLTRIPRASLSSTEYLHDPKLLERTKYSTIPREHCGPPKCSTEEHSINEGMQDRFPSTREFKTFKSGRVMELPGNHTDNNINFNAAYENPNFQRYF